MIETVQQGDLRAAWNEIARLQEESRQIREKVARGWELSRATFVKDLISPFLALPMLRGFWAGSVNSSGNWYDLSGLGKILTYNGNPTFNYTGLVGYWDLDGTGDYFSRVDEADLDILGTEAFVATAACGLTLGGWFWADAITGNDYVMSKWNATTNNRSYTLLLATNVATMAVSTDGINSVSRSSGAFSTSAWHSLVGRFVPSGTVDIYLDNVKSTNAVGIPASVFNGNAALEVGSCTVGTYNLDGRAALCFLCAAALSDAQISNLFQRTRAAFGV